MKRKAPKDLQVIIAPIVLLIFLVIGVEALVSLGGISDKILPRPSDMVIGTIRVFRVDILDDFLSTLKYVIIGITISAPLGILLAALFSQFKILVKAMTPIVILLVVTPMITLVPLLRLWMGLNPDVRIVAIVLQASPIIMLNTLTGFTNIETSKLEVMRSLGANRFQTFILAIFPNAFPQVFTGIKLGCIFGTIATIACDFILAGEGLGVRMLKYSRYLLVDRVFGCILLIGIIGFSLFSLVTYIEKKVIVWKI
jgi:NitT/TauT family transport system permease protein